MQPRGITLLTSLCLVVVCCAACTQQKSDTAPQKAPAQSQKVPDSGFDDFRILRVRGVLRGHEGKRLTGIVGVVFAIYEQREGGGPLWQEVQNVEADKRGHFGALVGSTTNGGIPPELFATEKTRWLGKQVLLPGEVEQPRIRVVSTPHGPRAITIVVPEKTANQLTTAGAQVASGQTTSSQQDQSGPTYKPPRLWRRLHHRRPMP